MLDYIRRKGEPDRTPEQMRQDIDVFLRECRKEYRKAGLEFKYIHVMEIGKKGARHHHLVVFYNAAGIRHTRGITGLRYSHWTIAATMQSWQAI